MSAVLERTAIATPELCPECESQIEVRRGWLRICPKCDETGWWDDDE